MVMHQHAIFENNHWVFAKWTMFFTLHFFVGSMIISASLFRFFFLSCDVWFGRLRFLQCLPHFPSQLLSLRFRDLQSCFLNWGYEAHLMEVENLRPLFSALPQRYSTVICWCWWLCSKSDGEHCCNSLL